MRYNSPYQWLHKCPFFKYESPKALYCAGEGDIDEIIVRFKDSQAKCKHIEAECLREFPDSCPYYEVILRKYEEM